VRGDDAVVFSELVDGEALSSTWLTGGLPLEVTLRVVLDALSGAEAIHALRDAKQRPMHLAHGEISTATVVVGTDGIARVLHAIARRLPRAEAARASLGYLAPEVHAGDAYDARADVFSAGVLLWEALSGRRLFEEADPAVILARMRSEGVPQASPSTRTAWALSLARIAAKALSTVAADRWPTAAVMASEIRKAAGLRLAPTTTAAAVARAAFGERTKSRRARWETQAAAPEEPVAAPLLAAAPSMPPEETPMALDDADLDFSETEISAPPRHEAALQPSDATLVAAMSEHEPRPPDESAPYFDAAVDLSIPPPPRQPLDLVESSVSVPASPETILADRASRRRLVTVLGGVAALGLIVFSLAGWRVAHRASHALPDLAAGVHAAATPAEQTAPPVEAAPSPARPAPVAEPPAPAAASASSTPQAASPRAAPPRAAAAHAPKAKTTPARKPATSRPQHAKPKTTHGYDPSAL
jgi:serine/threonine-protein kinase